MQIGYVTAERAPWIGKLLGEREVRAVFQGHAVFGGWARVAFDGEEPVFAPAQFATGPRLVTAVDDNGGFWPDPVYEG